jgi:hypothetical protein
MEKRLYKEKTMYLQPIEKPDRLSIFEHTILFINEEDTTIERAIPDFEEKYLDSESSNIRKINKDTYLSYFKVLDKKSLFLPSNEPIFEVKIFEGQADNPMKYIGPKVVAARCINFYTVTIEDIIFEDKTNIKRKIMQ